jgi:hypothetical protein
MKPIPPTNLAQYSLRIHGAKAADPIGDAMFSKP